MRRGALQSLGVTAPDDADRFVEIYRAVTALDAPAPQNMIALLNLKIREDQTKLLAKSAQANRLNREVAATLLAQSDAAREAVEAENRSRTDALVKAEKAIEESPQRQSDGLSEHRHDRDGAGLDGEPCCHGNRPDARELGARYGVKECVLSRTADGAARRPQSLTMSSRDGEDADDVVSDDCRARYRLDGEPGEITVLAGMLTDLASVPRVPRWLVDRVGRPPRWARPRAR